MRPTDRAIVEASRILGLALPRFYRRHHSPMAFHLRMHIISRVHWLVSECLRMMARRKRAGGVFGFEMTELAWDGCHLRISFRMEEGSPAVRTYPAEEFRPPRPGMA